MLAAPVSDPTPVSVAVAEVWTVVVADSEPTPLIDPVLAKLIVDAAVSDPPTFNRDEPNGRAPNAKPPNTA